MNRLNVPEIASKPLYGHQKFFNISEIKPEKFYKGERYAAEIKRTKNRLNLDKKINNILFNIHEQLRERQSSPKPFKPKHKSTQMKPEKMIKPLKELDPKHDQTINISCNSSHSIECKNISIPRMKVLCSDKHKKCLHKSTETPSKYISFDDHKRIVGSIQREDHLQSMLEEHKLLKQDRQSLELDIFALRHTLDDLQHRVNSCLKQLDSKKTYCECHGLKTTNNCRICNKI